MEFHELSFKAKKRNVQVGDFLGYRATFTSSPKHDRNDEFAPAIIKDNGLTSPNLYG